MYQVFRHQVKIASLSLIRLITRQRARQYSLTPSTTQTSHRAYVDIKQAVTTSWHKCVSLLCLPTKQLQKKQALEPTNLAKRLQFSIAAPLLAYQRHKLMMTWNVLDHVCCLTVTMKHGHTTVCLMQSLSAISLQSNRRAVRTEFSAHMAGAILQLGGPPVHMWIFYVGCWALIGGALLILLSRCTVMYKRPDTTSRLPRSFCVQ